MQCIGSRCVGAYKLMARLQSEHNYFFTIELIAPKSAIPHFPLDGGNKQLQSFERRREWRDVTRDK